MQATSEDQEFAWAYYNLGVVYTEMDEPQAAHQAFSKAREINPGAWQIHYALALNLFRCNSDSQEVIALCEKAFNLHPNFSDSSRILKLKGLAYKRLNDGKKSENSLKRASFFAIFALAGAYFHEDDVLNKRVLLSKCLQDLAKCHETADGNGVKEDLLKKAYSITPEDLNLWCDLAIYQKSISKKELEVRCKAIIDNYWDSTPGDLKRLANYNGLKELGYSDSLNKLARYRSQIESRSTADRSIEAKEPCYLDDIQRLNYARWALFLAERATTTDERENAINKIKIIINYLEESIQKNTESKVANYFWISLILCDLAQCYNKYNRLAMDLTTEVAKKDYFNKDIDIVEFLSDQNNEINIGNTKLNVEDFRESKRSFPHAHRHMVKRLSKKLDDIKAHSLFTDDKKRDFIKHFENNDYQLAKETLLKALMLDPNDPIIRYNLGVAYVREGFSLGDKSAIKRNMEIGNRYLTQSLELSKTKKNNMEIRYWLGVLYCQIREFEKAVSNFNICKSMSKEVLTYDKEAEFERWQVYLMLGDTYLRQKRYDDCEEELRKITEYLKEGDKIQEKACKYFDKKNNKEILIYAYLWLALIYLEKQIDLYKADQFIEKAKEQISSLNINESANEFKRNLERNLYACIGWKMLLQAQGIGIDLRKIDIDNKKKEVILHKGDIRDCDLTYDNGDKKYKFKKAQIRNAILSVDEKYIDVLNAEVSDATIEAADERARFKGLIDGNTIVPSNYGKYNFADLTEEKYKIKKAVEFESVKLVGSIEDIIQNVASLNSDPPLSMINESIFWLEESLALASDPQTCLLLAQALEVKLGLTSDAQVKDAITKKIRARCLLAIQLDIMDDYKQEIETISKKYEEKKEKKEEVKDKATPTSTISLSIEGTAKGDLTTKADSAKAK
ncbi:MAG: tetratricopeptide repeat protein [Methanothrix sp.]